MFIYSSIIWLLNEISVAVKDEFKAFLRPLVPRLIEVLHNDRSENKDHTLRILNALRVFASNGSLEDYLYVIIPELIRLGETPELPTDVRRAAVQTITHLSRNHDLTDYASRLVHPFSRVLAAASSAITGGQPGAGASSNTDLSSDVMEALCQLICQLGTGYVIFEPMMNKVLLSRSLSSKAPSLPNSTLSHFHQRYLKLVTRMHQTITRKQQRYLRNSVRSEPATANLNSSNRLQVPLFPHRPRKSGMAVNLLAWECEDWSDDEFYTRSPAVASVGSTLSDASLPQLQLEPGGGGHTKIYVNQQNLKKAWEASRRSTAEDWTEWRRGLSIELLKESPSPALRACSPLAMKYPPLATELFNAAFVSCWTELYDQYQDDLVRSLETAFNARSVSPQIIQALLSLTEFMEIDDKALPIDSHVLGDLAEKCHAYAKALHYKEIEFQSSPDYCIDALIGINNQLQQPDAAVGILEFAQENLNIELKESWYEKLQRWEDALETYERKQLEDPFDVSLTLGRMRCLKSLGDWDRLMQVSRDLWDREQDLEVRKEAAPLAAMAAWNTSDWKSMAEYIAATDENQVDGAMGRAVLSIQAEKFEEGQQYIDKARETVDAELSALVGEGYNRAYRLVVQIQLLAELEEIISFKTGPEERKHFIKHMWARRLEGCQSSVDVWQQILCVRSMVMPPRSDVQTWIKYSRLCRKSNRLALSSKVLTALLGVDPLMCTSAQVHFPSQSPPVVVEAITHMWYAGFHKEAFHKLCEFVSHDVFQAANPELCHLKSRCFLKLGKWQLAIAAEEEDSMQQQLFHLQAQNSAGQLLPASSPAERRQSMLWGLSPPASSAVTGRRKRRCTMVPGVARGLARQFGVEAPAGVLAVPLGPRPNVAAGGAGGVSNSAVAENSDEDCDNDPMDPRLMEKHQRRLAELAAHARQGGDSSSTVGAIPVRRPIMSNSSLFARSGGGSISGTPTDPVWRSCFFFAGCFAFFFLATLSVLVVHLFVCGVQ